MLGMQRLGAKARGAAQELPACSETSAGGGVGRRPLSLRLFALALTGSIGSAAMAFGLGEASVSSSLGQRLQMTVPLRADPGVELAQECVRLVPAAETGDRVPALSAARVSIDAQRGELRIESLQAIDEPALRVAVEIGCAQRVRREFTVLLDPPAATPDALAAPNGPDHGLSAPALGLGMAQMSAVLGQPLSIRIPVVGPAAASLSAECVRLADPISSDGAPVLRQARIALAQQDGETVIEVTTPGPVTEPAVRLAVDVGCVEPLRREYAIMLGLPSLAASNVPSDAAGALPARSSLAPSAKPAPARKPAAPRTRVADRLVLSPTGNVGPPFDAQAAQTVEMLKRMDDMTMQMRTLQLELAAARQRVLELELRSSQAREQWTWLLGALGGILVGGALAVAWRNRHVATPAWDAPSALASPSGVTAAGPGRGSQTARAASEIAGRGAMAHAPATVSAPTEPPSSSHPPTQITVTELHDTVQVIKELYATVFQRGPATLPSKQPERPLELDLHAPTMAAAAGPRVLGNEERGVAGAEGNVAEPYEEHFTELPTEVAIDLDLNTRVSAEDGTAPAVRDADETGELKPPHPACDPAVAPTPPEAFADEHLTQAPTEVSIDLDVGESSRFNREVDPAGPTPTGAARDPPERSQPGNPMLTPDWASLELQLDLGPARAPRRETRSA